MISFECPHCKNSMKVKDDAAGRKGVCKKCGNTVLVPDERMPIIISPKAPESVLRTRGAKHIRIPMGAINLFIGLVFIILVLGFGYLTFGPESKESIISKAEPSVAVIKGRLSSGTGFVIKDGILATNKHVISNELMQHIQIHFPSALETDKGPYEAELLYEDEKLDIAFLKIKPVIQPLPSLESYSFKRGQEVIVIGNPGLEGGMVLENAVSSGVMSTQTTLNKNKYDQINISINPGNSGGPVLNESGSVIGMVTLKANERDGIGFSIPIQDIASLLKKASNLSPEDVQKERDYHHARVLSWYSTLVGEIFRAGMNRYCIVMFDTLQAGGDPHEGINQVKSEVVKEIYLDKEIVLFMNQEIAEVSRSKHVSDTVKQRLVDLWTNSMELKSYFDSPRGSYDAYNEKFNELESNHTRLSTSLQLLLGLKKGS